MKVRLSHASPSLPTAHPPVSAFSRATLGASMRLLALLALSVGLFAQQPARDYPVKPVPFPSVHFNDVFWAPRIETNRTMTIAFTFRQDEDSKRVYSVERAAESVRGETSEDKKAPGYPFDDTNE